MGFQQLTNSFWFSFSSAGDGVGKTKNRIYQSRTGRTDRGDRKVSKSYRIYCKNNWIFFSNGFHAEQDLPHLIWLSRAASWIPYNTSYGVMMSTFFLKVWSLIFDLFLHKIYNIIKIHTLSTVYYIGKHILKFCLLEYKKAKAKMIWL